MKRIPEILFVVDGIFEKQAIREANALKLKTFAVLNTNWDDTVVDNCIPANTNSVKSVEFLMDELNSSIVKTSRPTEAKVRKVSDKAPARKPAVKRVKKEETEK